MKLQSLTLALAAAVLLAGCADGDDADTTTDATTTMGTQTTVPGNGTDGPGVNGTLEERTCTAVTGGTGSGWAQAGGQYVGGCPFGSRTTTATILANAQIPGECDMFYSVGNDNLNAQPAQVGEEYPADTQYSMFCGPGGINLTGTIQLQAVSS